MPVKQCISLAPRSVPLRLYTRDGEETDLSGILNLVKSQLVKVKQMKQTEGVTPSKVSKKLKAQVCYWRLGELAHSVQMG